MVTQFNNERLPWFKTVMSATLYSLTVAILLLCVEVIRANGTSTYRCIPGEQKETHIPSTLAFGGRGTWNATVTVQEKPISLHKCKLSLALYGELGSTDTALLNLPGSRSCILEGPEIGNLLFALLQADEHTNATCQPDSIILRNIRQNQTSVLACSETSVSAQTRDKRSSNERWLTIMVKTKDKFLAGTGAKIWMTFNGKSGTETRLSGSFKQGDTATTKTSVGNIGPIKEIRIHRNTDGIADGWTLDWVEIKESGQRTLKTSCNCDPGTGGRTLRIDNPCHSIQYCKFQLCETCKDCQSGDSTYFYRNDDTGRKCKKCPWIKNCVHTVESHGCGTCKKCSESGSSAENSIFWLTTDQKHCNPTCSWKDDRWCWPGHCGTQNYWTTDCQCEQGFKRIGATCDIQVKPDLLLCKSGMEDVNSETRNSTSLGNSSSCASETHTFVNVIPKYVSFKLIGNFEKKLTSTKRNYIRETKLGIVNSHVAVSRITRTGATSVLKQETLQGGGDCSHAISSSRPQTHLDCVGNIPINTLLDNGDWICLQMVVSSGGHFVYTDFDKTYKGSHEFTPVSESKEICFKYDNEPPAHCKAVSPSTCSDLSPLVLSTRVTKSPNITARISGWIDPYPTRGRQDQASGVDFYNIQVYGVKHSGLKTLTIDYKRAVFSSNGLKGSHHDVAIVLPDQPEMYVTYLEVHDIAGNVRFSRRFLLYDNNSTLEVNESKYFHVVSASQNTNYQWQIHHGKIRLDWRDRYHNDFYIHNDYFVPIKADTGNSVVGIYEQHTGVLPVSGTESVNGVTGFSYQWSRNNGTKTKWLNVPDFTKQKMSLNLPVKDGETYEVWIKAQDIMVNTIVESVIVHIDRSVAEIADTWLVREGTSRIYVHNDTDLSMMVLQFRAFDVHSGITSVQWSLGTANAESDIGTGALPVNKLDEKVTCRSNINCYCPDVGPCEYQNYTLTLNSLVANNTNIGKHNREYYFTLKITNGAMLKSFDHLDILVDESRPEVGTIQEGAAGGPDIDYTSESKILVSWRGFIDHESGIKEYIVALSDRCLTVEELKQNISSGLISRTEYQSVMFQFPKEGKFYSSVAALNQALEPSDVVCSDGITFDLSPPVIWNIELHQATVTPSLHCIGNTVWLVNKNLTMTKVLSTQACLNRCASISSDNNLRFKITPDGYTDNETADSFCSNLPFLRNTIMYIPSHKIVLNWTVSEQNSQIRDSYIGLGTDPSRLNSPDINDFDPAHGKTEYRLHRTGLGGSTEFFIFLKVENKAGLYSVVTLGPVMIDDTPPLVYDTLKPEIVSDHVRVAWRNGTFSDPEQQDNHFTVTFRALLGDQYVTPIIQTAKSLRKSCLDNGYSDCVKYSLRSLQLQDSELSKPCSFELYVYNSAGHYTTVRTQPIYLPSRFPPGSATVIDLDPSSLNTLVDVDYHRNHSACFQWFGFHHHKEVSFEAGIGLDKGHDNVLSFQEINEENKLYHCLSGTSFQSFTRYYVTIRATCAGGTSESSSDGFVIVAKRPDALQVYDGLGCEPFQKYSVDEISLSLNTGEKIEVTLNSTLKEGLLYTAIIENNVNSVKIDIQSNEIMKMELMNFGNYSELSYLPLIKSPSVNISSNNILNGTLRIYFCSRDTNYMSSESTYKMNWKVKEPYSKFMTSLKVQILQNQSSCSNCQSVVEASVETGVEMTHFKFTNLHLLTGVEYIGSVSPCFDHVCLEASVSDGVYLAPKPSIGPLQSVVKNENESCTDISTETDGLHCGDITLSGNIQWTIFKGTTDVTPLIGWMAADLTGGHTLKIDACVKLPIHTYQKLFTCVRLFCPTGQMSRRCVELMSNPYAQSYSSHVLFELPSDDNRLTNVENLLHSKHLGQSLKKLHEMEAEFINLSSTISAVITNSAGRNITWYLMKDKADIPLLDCASNKLCIKSKRSNNGYVRFGWVRYEDSSRYFICANVSAYKDEEGFKVCGNGFIVDNTPPIAGKVAVTTARSGFITETTHMEITWSGFKDILPDGGQKYNDGIKSYSVAIGNYALEGNILPWTTVGEMTWYRSDDLKLSHGETLYVSVQAEDHVGHVTSAVTSPFMVDLTPPLCGDIGIEGLLPHKEYMAAASLNIHMKQFIDRESSIKSMILFVQSAANTDSVTQRLLKPGTEFVNVDTSEGFVDGHQYTVQVQVTNNANLHSICKSGLFYLDNSPPHTGVIRDGSDKIEVDFQTDTTKLDCHWTGFNDAHSGIHEYRVGLGTSLNSLDVQPIHSVGLVTNFTFLGTFTPGVRYFTTVEACNQAGLCTRASSDGVVIDASPPVAGLVLVGHSDTHHIYHGHRAYVYSHWVGFEDPETGIHHFECCIGLTESSCDILNFTNTALSDSYFATGLHLPTSVPLFVTVRAYNPVGLMVESTSPIFQVDDTPPVAVKSPFFISTESHQTQDIAAQWENSLLQVAWKFEDDESPIHEHVLSFRTHHESEVAIEKIKICPVESHLLVLEKDNRLQNGDLYKVSVTSCNRAGLCTTSHSPDILIDSTPPLIGGFKPPMTWTTVNKNGSFSTNINLTWYGFGDPESNISHYQISIGRTYEGAELTGGFSQVNHDVNQTGQSAQLEVEEILSSGQTLILSIYAVNTLDRPSSVGKVTVTVISKVSGLSGILEIQRHSCDTHYCTKDCTCAVVGWKCRLMSKPLKCLDVSNSSSRDVRVLTGLQKHSHRESTPSLSCITGHWDVATDVIENITRFEWSMGLREENYGVGIFNTTEESVWYDVGKRREVVHCLSHDRVLESGEDYVVYVRAWYSDSHFSVSRSDSIRVDHTPPAVRRGRDVKDSDASCGKDFDIFHVNQSALMACWGGLFQESQTSIAEFTVWAGVTKYGIDLLPRQSTGLVTNISLPLERISPGSRYFVGVQAVNALNMSTTVISDGFLLDADRPIGGTVFNTIKHRDGLAHSDDTSIGLSWHGFQDHHSNVRRYHAKILEVESGEDIANITVTLQNSIVLKDLNLTHSHSYIASVMAEDFADHFSEPVFSKPIIIDNSAPTGFLCEEFVDISPLNMTRSKQVVGRDEMNEFLVELPLNNSRHFKVQVWLNKDHIEHELVQFEIGSLYIKSPFIQKDNQSIYVAQYEFTLEPEVNGNVLTITEFVRNSLDDVNITVLVCEQQKTTSGPEAISTHQLLPTQLSICARVKDAESGLKSLEIGVGTTRGGFQVKPLHHTVARFHELIDVHLPHGTPIFTTVVAENHAGLKSYFRSAPIILDHTSPSVSNLEVHLKYEKSKSEENAEESVAVEASWRAGDEESEIIACWCSLGHTRRSLDIADWSPAFSLGACQLIVPNPTHGQKIFLTVQCSNSVELSTVVTTDPLLISLKTPSSDESAVQIVSQNRYSCHGDGTIQSDKSSLKFQWTWKNKQGVKHYQCRAGGVGWTNTSIQYCEFLTLTLRDGETYTAQVRAVDMRERTSDVISTDVTVDDSTPRLTEERAIARRAGDSIRISHEGVFQHNSGTLSYTISVGSDVGYSDYLRQHKTRQQEVAVPLPVSVKEVFVTIMATAPVGTSALYIDSFKI